MAPSALPQCPALPLLAHWRWLGCKIRWALEADEPRLFRGYLEVSRQAIANRQLDAWSGNMRCVRLLHDTARDVVLPWHWRMQCLDTVMWPMAELQQLAGEDAARQHVVQTLCTQLARTDMPPSLPVD